MSHHEPASQLPDACRISAPSRIGEVEVDGIELLVERAGLAMVWPATLVVVEVVGMMWVLHRISW